MRRSHGFTLIELLIVVAIIGIIAALATPQLLRARMSSQEAGGIATLRAISSGQANYAATCGSGGYATDLADLAKAPPSTTNAFISPDMSSNGVHKSGYIFTIEKNGAAGTSDVTLTSCNGATQPRATSFYASADPIEPGVTGTMFFATDTPGVIFRQGTGAVPNPIPPGTLTVR